VNDPNGPQRSLFDLRKLVRSFAGIAAGGFLAAAAGIAAGSLFRPASQTSHWEDPSVRSQLVELRPAVPFGWPH